MGVQEWMICVDVSDSDLYRYVKMRREGIATLTQKNGLFRFLVTKQPF